METWQLCPKCKGKKKHFVTPLEEQNCNICDGTGIISVLNGLSPNKYYPYNFLNVPYAPPPNQIGDYPFGTPINCNGWINSSDNDFPIKVKYCNTCNNKKQVTGVKEDGLTYGYLCPDCK